MKNQKSCILTAMSTQVMLRGIFALKPHGKVKQHGQKVNRYSDDIRLVKKMSIAK